MESDMTNDNVVYLDDDEEDFLTEEERELFTPVNEGFLRVNWGSVEGHVEFSDDFKEEDHLTRADILADWIGTLKDEYEFTLAEMREDYERKRREAGGK
jgi:hypothetical protein